MPDLLKKIAYWVLVLALVIAVICSCFNLLNISPWCYPTYAVTFYAKIKGDDSK